MNWVKFVVLLAMAWMLATKAQASEVISLPEDELARESVLPVFSRPVSVRNRNIVTEGKFDLNFYYGLALSEPIYNVNRFGVGGYYHTSENNAFGVVYTKNSSGLSSYADQLGTIGNDPPDFSRAPSPQQTLMGDWNWKLFYGKMSLSKSTVFNTSLYTNLGVGMVQFSHKSFPVLAPGIGQKFYFTQDLAFRIDLRLFANTAPIPFFDSEGGSVGMGRSKTPPSPDQFEERLTFTTVLDAGLTWLF